VTVLSFAFHQSFLQQQQISGQKSLQISIEFVSSSQRTRQNVEQFVCCAKLTSRSQQGCQMVYFQTKNPNVGKFLMALD
jgi:hypothetical protein